jgi:hypothetical protein
VIGVLYRSFAAALLPLPRLRGMKNIKIVLTTAVLTVPVLLPTIAEARATWT